MDKKGTHNVKNLAEKYTKSDYSAYTRIGNGTENVCAYKRKPAKCKIKRRKPSFHVIQTKKRPGASLQPAPKKLESYKKIKLFICVSEIQI